MSTLAVDGQRHFEGLSEEQRRQFADEGYLVVENVIDVETYLDPMVGEYSARLDEVAEEMYHQGELSATYKDLGFEDRLLAVYRDSGLDLSRYFDFSLPLRADIRADEPCFFPPSVFKVLRNPNILDRIESLIGPEIYSNPVQHVRLKPPEGLIEGGALADAPGLISATPWHQDASVVIEEADKTEMITVWIPVFDATEENGCLVVVPDNHKGGLIEHCPAVKGKNPKYLSEKFFDAERAVALPMKRGSALFMSRTTPHSSLPNNSEYVRWSMDLRFNPTDQPTGRPEFPGFVARSRRDPSTELRDPVEWSRGWLETRDRVSSDPEIVGRFRRQWTGAGCA